MSKHVCMLCIVSIHECLYNSLNNADSSSQYLWNTKYRNRQIWDGTAGFSCSPNLKSASLQGQRTDVQGQSLSKQSMVKMTRFKLWTVKVIQYLKNKILPGSDHTAPLCFRVFTAQAFQAFWHWISTAETRAKSWQAAMTDVLPFSTRTRSRW